MSKERSSRRAPKKRQATRSKQRAQVNERSDNTALNPEIQERYRELARAKVLAAWPKILQGLIEKAIGGGYQHTKLLLNLCELAAKEAHQSDESPREQLCDALLNNLQLRPPE